MWFRFDPVSIKFPILVWSNIWIKNDRRGKCKLAFFMIQTLQYNSNMMDYQLATYLDDL